jgi:plastocyanin
MVHILLLTALALGGAAPPPAPLTVSLTNYRFNPAIIQLEHGHAYRLHLVNASTRKHNFVAPAFLAAAGRDARPIEVAAGGAVDVPLTAPAAGNYPLKCTHFTHALRGMTGWIIVK